MTRVHFDRKPELWQGDLFAAAWQEAARAWATSEGRTIEAWAVDRQFRISGQWWRIEWDGKEWVVAPVVREPKGVQDGTL